MRKRVRMYNISKGDATVMIDGEFIGTAMRVDGGIWWSMWRIEDPSGDYFDILDEHLRRRDAVARIVSEFDRRREMQSA